MNNQLVNFARQSLKEGLDKLNDRHRHLFKRMYAKGAMDSDINTVVDRMSEDKLDTAMLQVERTLTNLEVKK